MEDENYIDKLYKDSFQSFEIQPKKTLNFKEHQQLANTVEKKSFLKKLFATKWGIGFSIAFVVSIAIVGVLVLNNEPEKLENTKSETIIVEPKVIEESVVQQDTASELKVEPTKVETEIKKVTPIKKAEKAEKKSKVDSIVQPVIIRKTIIKRDTVLKHEKIIQNVPTTNEK